MNRVANLVGSVFVLAGLLILAYIGITYARSATDKPTTHRWSVGQARHGKQLALNLAKRQKLALPKARLAAKLHPGAPAVRIVIPRIGVDSPVVQTQPIGGQWDVADWAVGHLTTTPGPGVAGNGAYAAHDDIKGELFKRLSEVTPGAQILVYTHDAVYRYAVVRQLTVDPTDVSVLAQTKQPTVTLISCTPYWVDTQRLIVQAALKSSTPLK